MPSSPVPTKCYSTHSYVDRYGRDVIPPYESNTCPQYSHLSMPNSDIIHFRTLADWQGLEVVIEALLKILEQQAVRLQVGGRGHSRQRNFLLNRSAKREWNSM